MAIERCVAILLAGVLLGACGGDDPAEMSEVGYFTIGERTTSGGRPVEFLAILAEDAAAFGMGDPGDDLCVGVGSPAVEAAGVRVPLERLPGSDRLGVDVLAACFEVPPGGIDDVELVADDGNG